MEAVRVHAPAMRVHGVANPSRPAVRSFLGCGIED
jgi:hypothetical protein